MIRTVSPGAMGAEEPDTARPIVRKALVEARPSFASFPEAALT
jgi:hypothetical protein